MDTATELIKVFQYYYKDYKLVKRVAIYRRRHYGKK
jgi:hypothetical protein